jgi:hypothetical protein
MIFEASNITFILISSQIKSLDLCLYQIKPPLSSVPFVTLIPCRPQWDFWPRDPTHSICTIPPFIHVHELAWLSRMFESEYRLDYRPNDREIKVRFPRGIKRFFSIVSGAYTASNLTGTESLSVGAKWPDCKADYLLTSSAEVKNECSYRPPLPPYVFVMRCIIKCRKNFDFLLLRV